MFDHSLKLNRQITILIIAFAVLLVGCNQLSEKIEDDAVGMNGSFEHVQSGLPVNWLIYSPKTVKEGDFDLIIDTTDAKDGRQSLEFQVRECSSTGGWHSPGFCNEFDAAPGDTYKVSFWVKNIGSEFGARVGGVSAFEGEYETIVMTQENFADWQKFEHNYTIPEGMERLRLEVNVFQPGNFWIDDVRIERIDDGTPAEIDVGTAT